ncbi:hypothetical protein ABZ935_25700 [Streptomyces coeruleorubidus]
MRLELVVEVGVAPATPPAVATPARLHRPRTDLSPTDVPLLAPLSP